MKAYLQAKLFSYKKVLKYSGDHDTDFDGIDGFTDDKTVLEDVVGNIEGAEDIQGIVTKGVTDDTEQSKIDMANIVVQYAHLGRPKAKNAGKESLVKAISFEVYQIVKASRADALSIARNILETLKDAIFTNIKPADKTAMQEAIDKYDAAQVEVAVLITKKKVEGTMAYYDLFKKGDLAVDNMFDYVYGTYNISKPKLVKGFKDAKAIEIEGVRHTGLVFTCLESKPLKGETPFVEGVLCRIVERNKEVVSDIDGVGSIITFQPGTYHVEFSKEGYVTKHMIISFKRGEIVQMEVLMDRGE